MSAYIKTIVESPKRQLDRSLGIERSTSNRPRAGDWQKIGDGTPLRCGLRVWDIADERHVGRVTSYEDGLATIRWEETGWLSDVHYADLRLASLDHGVVDQMVMTLLEVDPHPRTGYYGYAVEAATEAYRVYRGRRYKLEGQD